MNLKRVSAEILRDYLQAGLGDYCAVYAGPPDDEDREPQPSVRIIPGMFTLEPFQSEPVDETIFNSVLSEVGWWEGKTEIRIISGLQVERENIEERVVALLMGGELNPGVTVVQTPPLLVGNLQTFYRAPMSWILDEESWHEEYAFDDHRYSYLELDTVVPALTVTSEVYTINDLRFEIEAATTTDLSGAVVASNAATFAVDSSGNITPSA